MASMPVALETCAVVHTLSGRAGVGESPVGAGAPAFRRGGEEGGGIGNGRECDN